MAIVLPKFPRFRTSVGSAVAAAPALTIELCRADGQYVAGQPLRAYWQLGNWGDQEIVGLECSVLWFTEGKGDEDLHVHHFARWNESQLQRLSLSARHAIDCVLPLSPVSYHGTLLRICWCVRLRLFRSGGLESVAQQPFKMLGIGSDTDRSSLRPS